MYAATAMLTIFKSFGLRRRSWVGLEIKLLVLVADSEQTILLSLSDPKPNRLISSPNDG